MQSPPRTVYAGLFVTALATLTFEILLTRILSVTLWYHFAFMAISLAMFGMTAGAIAVYAFPKIFGANLMHRRLVQSAVLFACSIAAAFLIHLWTPFGRGSQALGLLLLCLNFAVMSVPFVFSGVAICLCLTRFPRHVGRLYAADLAGAALGCVVLVALLSVADGPSAVFMVAGLAAVGAALFAVGMTPRWWLAASVILAVGFGSLGLANAVFASTQKPLIRLRSVKGVPESPPIYERWNSFSRIAVHPDSNPGSPFGWGLSEACPADINPRELDLRIDGAAKTVLTAFDGNLSAVEHLRYDIVNLAHHVRTGGRVLVMGSGGGRDVLSALLFGEREVHAVEINSNIVRTANEVFGDFTGHLDRLPNVRFVADEARSFLARQGETYDLIQVSLIDSWAATAAGAFALTENSLYTLEAWNLFLSRLSDGGLLTFSRWYFRDRPAEMYRVTSLAAAALKTAGIRDLRRHILIARRMYGAGDPGESPEGVGTILVSKRPFSAQDLARFDAAVEALRFEVVLAPERCIDETFDKLTDGSDTRSFLKQFPLRIDPPTDDSPFFFHALRVSDFLRHRENYQGSMQFNVRAVTILGALFVLVTLLLTACVLLPLALTTRGQLVRGATPHLCYFVAIGLAFMLVEIALMQRLTVFLGHPTYSLVVLLFTILLSSGAGSYLAQLASGESPSRRDAYFVFLIPLVVGVMGMAALTAAPAFEHTGLATSIALSVAFLIPMGVVMGMAFPIGMKNALAEHPRLSPWLWGLNGAASVVATVLAVVIAMSFGISTSLLIGTAFYGVAAASFILMQRGRAWSALQ
jgi:hypothetical protein